MHHFLECGLTNIWLINGYELKERKEGGSISFSKLDDLHRVIGENLLRKRELFSDKELKFLRIELDLSPLELAAKLNTDEKTIIEYESGEKTISRNHNQNIKNLCSNQYNLSGNIHCDKYEYKVDSMYFKLTNDYWEQKIKANV